MYEGSSAGWVESYNIMVLSLINIKPDMCTVNILMYMCIKNEIRLSKLMHIFKSEQ